MNVSQYFLKSKNILEDYSSTWNIIESYWITTKLSSFHQSLCSWDLFCEIITSRECKRVYTER